MEETIFPPSPNWCLPSIMSSREDGSISYGSKNNIVILKALANKNTETLIIPNAHTLRITSVAFSPTDCSELFQNTVASCSDDGFVKLWKIDSLSAFMGHKSHWETKGEIGKVITLDWSFANTFHIVSVAENNSIVLWDIQTNTTMKFSFQKLGASVIACCPYNEKILAVGAKTGQIFIINLTGSGEIIYRLRGHDNKIQSLSWCPMPYNIFNTNEVYEEFLLASTCQDKEVFIWRAGSDGKCEIKFHIPTSSLLKKDGGQHQGKLGNSFSYSCVFWFDPYKIYLSSNFGELLFFDIKSYLINSLEAPSGQKLNKQLLISFKLGHSFHSKGIFSIAGFPIRGDVILHENQEIKSNIKFKIQSKNYQIIQNLKFESEIKDFKWEIYLQKKSPLLWTSGQDRKLVGCKFNTSQVEMIFNFHTMNGFVYCAVPDPNDPNKIAVGVGDGMIRLWNLTEPIGKIQIYWQKIKDRVMALAWHPLKDGILAYGTSEGRIGLIDLTTNKLPNVFKPSHPQPIYNISWGPHFHLKKEDYSLKSEFNLYSVGDNKLLVYNPLKLSSEPINLSKIIPFLCKKQTDVSWKPDYSLMAVGSEDGSICLIEPSEFTIVYTLMAYKKLIESIAWHPSSTSLDNGLSPFHGYFSSGSTDNDNEIRVFNYKTEEKVKIEQIATLKGHYGYIQAVSWSPHMSGRLISSSADCSVQIWDVTTQTPLINFKPSGMPLFSIWSPIDSDLILTGCRNDVLCVWRISTQTETVPSPVIKIKKKKKEKNFEFNAQKEIDEKSNAVVLDEKEIESLDFLEAKTPCKSVKELKMFSKAWKGNVNDEFEICYSVLKKEKGENDTLNYSLPFLCDDDSFKEMIKSEGESYRRTNNWIEYYELSLWEGNIKDILEEKIKTGQLNDFLVSLAPIISPRVWQEACLSYAKSLSDKKLFRKAASYLVICHKIYEAIELLASANLYLEALCIARSRLPKSDPAIRNLVIEYAKWLNKNGCFLKACECYVFLGDYLEVAKICSKKSQPEYLSLAALAAKKGGFSDLESLKATDTIMKCLETNNFDLAKRVCDDHYNLKHLRLMCHMYFIIYQVIEEELILEKDILSYVKESLLLKNVIFPSSFHPLYHKYSFYKNKCQMLIVVAQELSFAYCAQDLSNIVEHLIKALSTCYRYIKTCENEYHPLIKLCSCLSPDGFLIENSYFNLTETSLLPKMKSMKAFLCSAVVQSLNNNLINHNLLKYLKILNEVKDNVLDKESYNYFKNLIELEICEKRLISNRNKITRVKLSNGKEKYIENSSNESSSKNLNENSVKNEVATFESKFSELLNFEEARKYENHSTRESLEKLENINIKEEFLDGNFNDIQNILKVNDRCQSLSDGDLENAIFQDLDLLQRLKNEIQSFEILRISSPNPVPLYFMLKKFLEVIPEESSKFLLQHLEKTWQELN